MSSVRDAENRKIAVYIRFGNENQDVHSFQLRKMMLYVEEHPNWELVKIFTDTGSAHSLSRQCGFSELIQGVRNSEYSIIAIPSSSTLGRNILVHHGLLSKLEKAGATVEYADGTQASEIKRFAAMMKSVCE